MPDNVHSGHRKRVRDEFLKCGFSSSTPQHKIIEMLLFYSIPRKDTNEIAHNLINRFGSVSAMLDASPEELMKVKGVSENTAALIKLLVPIAKIYLEEKNKNSGNIQTMDDMCNYVIRKHFGFTREVFAVTTLNGKGSIIGFDIINTGDISSVGVSTRDVIETVIKRNAVCAVISHNHPSGSALPSNDDIKMTVRIAQALAHINVKLLDHIIVADEDCVSMSQSAAYQSIFCEEN